MAQLSTLVISLAEVAYNCDAVDPTPFMKMLDEFINTLSPFELYLARALCLSISDTVPAQYSSSWHTWLAQHHKLLKIRPNITPPTDEEKESKSLAYKAWDVIDCLKTYHGPCSDMVRWIKRLFGLHYQLKYYLCC